MGANPYWYFVPYEADFDAALQKLRAREFQSGRYNPVTPFQKFPVDMSVPVLGAQHGSIEEVIDTADESGTRSILDISAVGIGAIRWEPDAIFYCVSFGQLRH